MVKLGLIVFANDSGLGIQTKRLCHMLRPYRLLVIDSTSFSQNKEQHIDWYEGFSGYTVDGFPKNHEIKKFLTGLTHVLCAENPLNVSLLSEAKRQNIKVYIQSNYEFCDHLQNPNLVLPHKFLMPSYWHLNTMIAKYGSDLVEYLPPPMTANEFTNAREKNFKREGNKRFLHIVGTLAVHDRNGTLSLLHALNYTDKDFELVIKSQRELPPEYMVNDRRVRYQIGNELNIENLYMDFDALIIPRRYGGLCLTMNEGLMCGLPVIMSDVDPNNKVIPKKWLVEAVKTGEFFTRTMIDIYSTSSEALAHKIDWLVDQNMSDMKTRAFQIGYDNYSEFVLRQRYARLWSQ